MAAEYLVLSTTRTTPADLASVLGQWRAQIAPDVGYAQADVKTFTLKKEGVWTDAQKATAQTVLDTAPPKSPQLDAQRAVDNFQIEYKALVLALVDQINVLRSKLVPPLPDITPAQAITAIRAKAGSL